MKYTTLLSIFLYLLHTTATYAQAYFNHIVSNDTLDIVYLACETVEDGLIVTGFQKKTNNNLASFIIQKVNQNGELLWTTTHSDSSYTVIQYEGTSSLQLQPTPDGHFVALVPLLEHSTRKQKMSLIKFTSEGTILWTKDHILLDYTHGKGILPLDNNGFLIWGQMDSAAVNFIELQPFVLAVDAMGHQQWLRTYRHYSGDPLTSITGIIDTKDGGFLIGAGRDIKLSQHFDVRTFNFIKIDATGQIQWQKEHDQGFIDQINVFQQMKNDHILIAGVRSSNHSNTTSDQIGPYIAQLDTAFNLVWENTYAHLDNFFFITDLQITPLGNIVSIISSHYPSIPFINFGSAVIHWNQLGNPYTYTVLPRPHERMHSELRDIELVSNTDNSFFVAGYHYDLGYPVQGWLLRMDEIGNTCHTLNCDSVGNIVDGITNPLLNTSQITFLNPYPNPATHTLSISFSPPSLSQQKAQLILYNLQGQVVHQQSLSSLSPTTLTISTQHLPTGIYLLSLEQKGIILEQQKVLITP